MGLRFRKSFQLFPGVKLNVSGGGVSASFGAPGATFNVSESGVRATVGIPGSGVSFSHQLADFDGDQISQPRWQDMVEAPVFNPGLTNRSPTLPATTQIASIATEALTSDTLADLRDALFAAREQRRQIEEELVSARRNHQELDAERRRREASFFRWFYKKRLAALIMEVPVAADEVERLVAWRAKTNIVLAIEASTNVLTAFANLVRSFDLLRQSNRIWDVTAQRGVHRLLERSNADRKVDRKIVTLSFTSSDLIKYSGRALKFDNVNGDDIFIYPGIALMPREDGVFALIDIKDLSLDFRVVRFTEDEEVPSDTQIVGLTWAKENRDGTPDRRFKDNYQMPVCMYGELFFQTETGVSEAYQFSRAEAARDFAVAFEELQKQLRRVSA